MAVWTEQAEAEVQRLLNEQDVSEVIVHAVSQIAQGHVGCFACNILNHTASHDPRQDIEFGERLLCAAIDKLRSKQ